MTSFVYFVKAGPDGPIKIGSTGNIEKRIASLQTGCPYKIEILGIIECEAASKLERDLHRKFSSTRIDNSEWFRWSEDLQNTIDRETRPPVPSRIDVAAAAAVAGVSLILLPRNVLSAWLTEARRNGRSPYTMLYLWLRREHGAGAIDDQNKQACTLHNRTRVGDLTMSTLIDIEHTRLQRASRAKFGHKLSPSELRMASFWTNAGGGPMTTDPSTGRSLIGEGLFVITAP